MKSAALHHWAVESCRKVYMRLVWLRIVAIERGDTRASEFIAGRVETARRRYVRLVLAGRLRGFP